MPDIWGLSLIVAKFLLYLGVLTSAGVVLGGVLLRFSDARTYALRFAILGFFGAALGFSLNGAALVGDASGMIDPEMLGLLWSTSVGTSLVFQLAGLALLIAGLAFGDRNLWISAIGGTLALWSFTALGHVSDQEELWLNAFLMVHLFLVSLWIGILNPLKRLADAGDVAGAADLGRRFGRIAMFFVPLLILAGAAMAYRLVGSFSALVGTGYGLTLSMKVILVAALLSLAALNKLRFVPRLKAGEVQASRHLSRVLCYEWAAFLLLLGITAVLTSVLTPPL